MYELILSQLGHRWARKLALLITFFSIITIVFNASFLFYHYKKVGFSVAPLDLKSFDAARFTAKNEAQLELFGHYDAHAKAQAFIPISELEVALVSIMYSKKQPDQSLAVMRKNEHQTDVYHLHDELFPGIVIDKILNDRVIVNNNGHLELIKLPKLPQEFTFIPVRGGL